MDAINLDDASTWKDKDLNTMTMAELYSSFGLEAQTIDFLGHAVALQIEDSYMQKPAIETARKMQLYMESIGKYGDSPFLYPVYGLGGLPESFSRLCAIHGGTYMLNTPVDEVLFESGRAVGVRCGEESARAPLVICDPSYVQGLEKTRVIGKVIRAICILDHDIPNTNASTSCQIIIPQKQVNRNYGKSAITLRHP